MSMDSSDNDKPVHVPVELCTPEGFHEVCVAKPPMCDACRALKWKLGLTPNDWERLHRQARACPKSGPALLYFPKLPPAPKPHKLTAEKHLEQLIKACGKLEDGKRPVVQAYIGRPYPGGYVCRATDGSVMVLQKSEGAGKAIHRLNPADTYTISIPDPRFELVLRRAKICSNGRSHGVTFTGAQDAYQHPGLQVEAKQGDDWSSSEFFPCDLPTELLGARWCLNADYLLACCGRWPWRWEVGANQPGDKYDAASCSPHAIYWDADGTAILIMPMRV